MNTNTHTHRLPPSPPRTTDRPTNQPTSLPPPPPPSPSHTHTHTPPPPPPPWSGSWDVQRDLLWVSHVVALSASRLCSQPVCRFWCRRCVCSPSWTHPDSDPEVDSRRVRGEGLGVDFVGPTHWDMAPVLCRFAYEPGQTRSFSHTSAPPPHATPHHHHHHHHHPPPPHPTPPNHTHSFVWSAEPREWTT